MSGEPWSRDPDLDPQVGVARAHERIRQLEAENASLRATLEQGHERESQLLGQNQELRATLAVQEVALRELLDAPIWSHEHWDPKGTSGTNCQTCIAQREARNRAEKALPVEPSSAADQWRALVRAADWMLKTNRTSEEELQAETALRDALALPLNTALRTDRTRPEGGE